MCVRVAYDGTLTPELLDSDSEASCDPVKQYANSKLMVLAFSNQLQNRLEDFSAGVVSNAIDPGMLSTLNTKH